MPDSDIGYAIKANAEFELGMFNNAISDIQKALDLNNCPEYQLTKAKVLYKVGNYELSKKILTEVVKNIQISEAYEYIGLCDCALGNYSGAILNIDKALLLTNNNYQLEEKYEQIKQKLEAR